MSATSQRRIRGLLLAIAFSVEIAMADIEPSFVWGFNTFKGTSLQECARLQIFVGTSGNGISTQAQPPYTLIAYEAAGITTVQTIGTDLNNLWWNVDHAAGAQLVLSMADANANAGGVAEDLYTVTSGTTSSCHAQNPTSPVSITTNTTKTITSCEILPLQISGGTKPYTVTVAALGSATVTNVTLGAAYDTYNWVDRASPNAQMIATVSDAKGIYAPSTNLITTSGSTDLTCGGRESTEIDSTGQASAIESGTSAVSATASSTTTASSKGSNSSSLTPIIAGAVGGVVLIGALILGALFFLKRRKLNVRGPRPYTGEDSYNGFGLGKVGGPDIGQNVAYGGVAEEITPFVMAGGQTTPYSDHSPYHNGTYNSNYSSAASETTLGPTMQPRMSTYSVTQSVQPTGYSVAQNLSSRAVSPPATGSVASFDPYGAYGGMAAGSVAPTSPSEYTSASGFAAQPLAVAGAAYATHSVAGSEVRTGEAGPSITRFAVANPSAPEPLDEKQGPVPPPARQETVIQHEDISDVVELPPAYKERTES